MEPTQLISTANVAKFKSSNLYWLLRLEQTKNPKREFYFFHDIIFSSSKNYCFLRFLQKPKLHEYNEKLSHLRSSF